MTWLLWSIPSFFIHCVLHEAAHAHVAGWRGVTVWPFPGWRSGVFRFAYMTPTPGNPTVAFWTAPLWVEGAWWVAAILAYAFFPAVRPIALIEATFALVDCTTWAMPFFWKQHWYTDAMRYRALTQEPLGELRCMSVASLFCPWLATVALAIEWGAQWTS
jgi:hypothetical protein